jgi:hypothetical protein
MESANNAERNIRKIVTAKPVTQNNKKGKNGDWPQCIGLSKTLRRYGL